MAPKLSAFEPRWQLVKCRRSWYFVFVTQKILFIIACLVLPVVWGWLVHALFRFVSRKIKRQDDDSIFPDFQI